MIYNHQIRSDENRLCGCGGRNCLETFASANGLVLSMRKKLELLDQS
ncbi:ROK family protein [Aerococcus urinaeequi]